MFIDSPGGLVDAGMAIYDAMKLLTCPVTTVCTGLAASMAAVLFISGKHRRMLPHSRLMLHDPLISETGGSALRLKSISEDLMETRKIIAGIVSEHSNLSVDEVLAKTSSDTYFRAEEAVRLGLADGISESV